MKRNIKIWGVLSLIVILIITFAVINRSKFQRRKPYVIGITQWVSNSQYKENIRGFKEELAQRGFVEGENIKFILENPEGDKAKQEEIIQSFQTAGVDLIYSLTTPGTLIAKKIISVKPIVFSIVTYPIEAGLIHSLDNSGNNLVGTVNQIMPSKQYYIFERIYDQTKTLAFVHRKEELGSVIQFRQFRELLEERGVKVLDIAAIDLEDIRARLESKADEIDAVYSACDTLIQSGGEDIVIDFSKSYKKPVFTCNKNGVLKGALCGNVTDFYCIGKIAGEKAAFILKGAWTSWLHTESPREDYVLINKKTADALGLTIPQDILEKAKIVISE